MPCPGAGARPLHAHHLAPEDSLNDLKAEVTRFFSDPAGRRAPDLLYRRLVRTAPVLQLGPVWVDRPPRDHALAAPPGGLGAAVGPRGVGTAVAAADARVTAREDARCRDGEDHRRLKRLAVATFSAATVARNRGLTADAVDELLEEPLRSGGFDVVADLAVPLPVAISCALLNVPPEDRSRVLDWSTLFSSRFGRFVLSDEERDELQAKIDELLAYIARLCEERRRVPGDDLLSGLIATTAAASSRTTS